MTVLSRDKTDKFLDMAFDLAENGRGRTNPNPMVGAVVAKDSRILGKGFHARAGEPHAEIGALREAGERAKGATLYVTLEPCSHYGRTPPCSDAIIDAGITEVVVGCVDPNPQVSGSGIRHLKDNGISVVLADRTSRAADQNEVFFKYIKSRKPFVLLKIAMSIDGKIAETAGKPTRITGPKAQLAVHRLRNEYQAVLVGIATALSDDPLLTCRLEGDDVRQPIRIVLDSTGRLPLDSRLVRTAKASPLWLATTDSMPAARRREFEARAVNVLVCRRDNAGRVDLEYLQVKLGEREITSVMAEGGATLNAALISSRSVDKYLFFIAPKIIGGTASLAMASPVGEQGIAWKSSRIVGEDIMIEGYPL